MKRSAVVVTAMLLPLALTRHDPGPPAVAGPRLVMFYGGALDSGRRYLTDLDDVIAFGRSYRRLPQAPPTDTLGRPHVNVALYWNNPLWEPYASDTSRLATLPLPRLPWNPPLAPWSPPPPSTSFEDLVRFVQPARLYLGDRDALPLFQYLAGGTPGLFR